jgi:hypothetical protein
MNTSKGSELASILRRLADYIERRSEDDLAPLFAQTVTLKEREAFRKRVNPSEGKPATLDLSDIAAQLRMLPSREAGEALLRTKGRNRSALEAIARFLQLPVQRDDTVERLRAKIVENTIGSRLRSDAIQGKDL